MTEKNSAAARLRATVHWGEGGIGLAHIAEHIGMLAPGSDWPVDLTPGEVIAHFEGLSPAAQAEAIAEIEECPW